MIDPLKILRLQSKKSPIETIVIRKINPHEHNTLYEATAFLKTWKTTHKTNNLYNNASGAGSSKFKFIASLKASSEALERATFEELRHSTNFGLNIVCSTSGFASFPGIDTTEARLLATNEAIERWCLVEWWNKKLEHFEVQLSPQYKAIVIKNPFNKWVIITYTRVIIRDQEYLSYGFGCSDSKQNALFKSRVELERNMRAVFSSLKNAPMSLHDKRLIFFSTTSGAQLFDKRRHETDLDIFNDKPKTIVDAEVPGSFQKYVKTWRTLYENSTYDFLDRNNLTCFYF